MFKCFHRVKLARVFGPCLYIYVFNCASEGLFQCCAYLPRLRSRGGFLLVLESIRFESQVFPSSAPLPRLAHPRDPYLDKPTLATNGQKARIAHRQHFRLDLPGLVADRLNPRIVSHQWTYKDLLTLAALGSRWGLCSSIGSTLHTKMKHQGAHRSLSRLQPLSRRSGCFRNDLHWHAYRQRLLH